MMSSLTLDKYQAEAVASSAITTLVMAGPGAGKTRLILGRLAYLLDSGVPPEEILILTFSTRAAAELLSRAKDLGLEARIKTFHAAARALLKDLGQIPFRPATEADRRQALEEALEEEGHGMSRREKGQLLSLFSLIKAGSQEVSEELVRIFVRYNHSLEVKGLCDFDDFLLAATEVLKKRRSPFRAVIVDELQDASYTDLAFLQALEPESYFLVGDPFQAIYGFRGAVGPELFAYIQKSFPRVVCFDLKYSYRVPKIILDLARRLVGGLPLESRAKKGAVSGHLLGTARAEAVFIGKAMESLVGGRDFLASEISRGQRGLAWGDFAVLVRVRALLSPLKDVLSGVGIPVCLRDESAERLRQKIKPLLSLNLAGLPPQDLELQAKRQKIVFSSSEREYLQRLFPLVESAEDLVHELLFQAEAPDEPGAVSLTTVHAAKGLEFPVVFVAGFEEGLFPFELRGESDEAEERRLAYVAFTRAKERLFLTASAKRTIFGKRLSGRPSPFSRLLGVTFVREASKVVPKRPRQGSLF